MLFQINSFLVMYTHTAKLKFKTYLLTYTFDRFPKKMKLIPEPSNWAKKRAAKHRKSLDMSATGCWSMRCRLRF